jgi:hypothetical protein
MRTRIVALPTLCVGLTLSLAAAAASLADTRDAADPGHAPPPGACGTPGGEAGTSLAHVERRLDSFRENVGLTDAQMPEWNAFAETVRSLARSAEGMTPPMTPGCAQAMTAPARLEVDERLLAARLHAVRTMRPAFERLYAALTGEQKKAADAFPMGPRCPL